jgi:hypothetical protein
VTPEQMIELAKRAVACKGWRWMPGMRTVRDDGHGFHIGCTVAASKVKPEWLPDLTDPATVGCLLALVREAWGDHATSFANGYEEPQGVWVVHNGRFSSDDYGHEIAKGSTEAEALVAALETAQ